MTTPLFFETPAAFGRWLERHGGQHTELIVGFHKVDSGLPSMTWSESVDEALCFGWIDGVRKRIDEVSYQVRFTPRKPGSIWSTINIAKIEALTQQGRMHPAGVAAFALRKDHRSSIYSYEQATVEDFAPADLKRFKSARAAWRFFESMPPGYRKLMTHRVVSAKQAATRERRLALLIQACAEQRKLL
ncbi:YdeI/OmpD-associated family protein [soil metagenome]